MPVPALIYSPIRARNGKLVHAITLHEPTKTACGKKCDGWIVALKKVDCVPCQRQVFFPVKTKKKGA